MAIIRWDPFVLQPWFRWPRWMEEWEWPEWSEPSRGLRIRETDKDIVVEAVVAGVPAENVEVTIEDGVLTIKAEVEEKEEKTEKEKVEAEAEEAKKAEEKESKNHGKEKESEEEA